MFLTPHWEETEWWWCAREPSGPRCRLFSPFWLTGLQRSTDSTTARTLPANRMTCAETLRGAYFVTAATGSDGYFPHMLNFAFWLIVLVFIRATSLLGWFGVASSPCGPTANLGTGGFIFLSLVSQRQIRGGFPGLSRRTLSGVM